MKAIATSIGVSLASILWVPSVAHAQQSSQIITDIADVRPADAKKFYKEPGYSPYAGKHYPARPLFGDQHLHTGWSVDAGLGGATLSPEDAVRFARGEQVTSSSGQPVRLSRPLDWVAVTDHSDAMGTIAAIREGNPEMMKDPTQALARRSEEHTSELQSQSNLVCRLLLEKK